MQIYTVGRENAKIDLDVKIPSHEETVGRLHINLGCEADGRYCITDRGALHKTFIMVAGSWRQITEAHVEEDTPLMLGSYQTTVKLLLEMRLLQAEQGPSSLDEKPDLPQEPSEEPSEEVMEADPESKGVFSRLFGKKS